MIKDLLKLAGRMCKGLCYYSARTSISKMIISFCVVILWVCVNPISKIDT